MKAILYARKSSESEDRQVQSIESQLSELHILAEKLNIEILGEYTESQSAKKLGRSVFAEVIEQITSGQADTLFVWKLDRLARNMVDGGLIMELLTTGVLKQIVTPEKTYYSTDNVLFMSVVFGMANQYSRDLSTVVKRGNRTKLENGVWPNKAPLGYVNNKNTKKIDVCPIEAKYVQKVFGMYSTGTHSCKDISDILYKDGFKSKLGNQISTSNIHLILQNTFYFGMMKSNGNYYKGNHTPLISKKIFDLCQEVRTGYKKAKPQKTKELHFSMRGIFRCENCDCAITAEKQKGINYYHCTNGKKICDQKKKFIREDDLEKELVSEIEKIKFDDELIDILHDASLEIFHASNKDTQTHKKALESKLQALRAKESILTDKLLEGILSNEIYNQKSKEIKLEIFDLERRINAKEIDIEKELLTFELTRNAFKAFNFNDISFSEMKNEKKHKTLQKLLSNSTLKNENGSKTLILQYKKPYDRIARASFLTSHSELLPD